MMFLSHVPLLLLLLVGPTVSFQSVLNRRFQSTTVVLHATSVDRRTLFHQAVLASAAAAAATLLPQQAAAAAEVDMKIFVDPVGLFVISTPEKFFRLRRSAKGDLPDAKTGKGRRGSSIFSAGDMSKAEVVAVERFPTRVLLEENGIEATGDLSTFPKIGEPAAVANLLNLRRERDKTGGQSVTQIYNAAFDPNNNKILTFMLKTEIDVMKPELLMEQYGVDRLFRVTSAKASLESNDGNIMAAFASALETDFDGPDGVTLQKVVDSFLATDQSAVASSAE